MTAPTHFFVLVNWQFWDSGVLQFNSSETKHRIKFIVHVSCVCVCMCMCMCSWNLFHTSTFVRSHTHRCILYTYTQNILYLSTIYLIHVIIHFYTVHTSIYIYTWMTCVYCIYIYMYIYIYVYIHIYIYIYIYIHMYIFYIDR